MSKAHRTGIISSSVSLATPGNDTITVTADSLIDATLEGGEGTDTVQLNGGGLFDLSNAHSFESIEIIQGSAADDIITIRDDNLLDGIGTIDGGGGEDTLVLYGYDLDLRNKTITGFKEIQLVDIWGTGVTLNNKDLALQITGYASEDDHLFLEGDVAFTDEERKLLFDNGIDVITDKNGEHFAERPDLAGLNENIHLIAGRDDSVLLDVDGNAVVSDGDDTIMGSMWVGHDVLTASETVSIRETAMVALSADMTEGSTISVLDGGAWVVIGTITNVTGAGFNIDFDGTATHARVQQLLHALEYRNTSDDPSLVFQRNITVAVGDVGGRYSQSLVNIAITPDGYKVLTWGADDLTGTAGADTFVATNGTLGATDKIVGGDGDAIDTLQAMGGFSAGTTFDLALPAVFTGIEAVRMTASHNDVIKIDTARMEGITTLDGGAGDEDKLQLVGTSFDLTGKQIENMEIIELVDREASIIVDKKEVAALVHGDYYGTNKLELVGGGTFSRAELKALFEQDIKVVTDANGEHTNEAPVINGLSGDRIKVTPGGTVFMDADRNATVSDDFDSFSALEISVTGDGPSGSSAGDRLGINIMGSVKLPGGLAYGGKVLVDGVEIGTLGSISAGYIRVNFKSDATAAQVQEVVRALTYSNERPAGTPLGSPQIHVLLWDGAGKTTTSTISVEEGSVAPGNSAPTNISLSTNAVKEIASTGTVVGSFQVTDPDAGDAFTFALLDDAGGRFAIRGNELVVANGAKLDFEQAASHQVKVRVTDKGGMSVEKSLIVTVQDVDQETAPGTVAPDNFVGGMTSDTLSGGLGNDSLNGGGGDDRLNGGLGGDILVGGTGKDVFVFDSAVAKKKNANIDKITDFNTKDDSIWLDNAIFKGLGKKGSLTKPAKLSKDAFFKGEAAHDVSDRIIVSKSGKVYYDADGTGSQAKIHIATLNKAAFKTIGAGDFLVI